MGIGPMEMLIIGGIISISCCVPLVLLAGVTVVIVIVSKKNQMENHTN